MASRSREQRIIDAVPCPTCRAPVGQLCRILTPDASRRCHGARRRAWQDVRLLDDAARRRMESGDE